MPKLRFSEFTEDWIKYHLKEIAEKVNNKNNDNKIETVFSNSAVQGIVLQSDYFDRSIANKENLDGYYIVEPFDFVYNPRLSAMAEVGAMSVNNTNLTGLVSPLYTVFRIKESSINILFLEYLFKSKVWHNYMRSIANYGARDDRMNVRSDDFYNLPLLIPSFSEQKTVSTFLSLIESRIQTQKKIIEDLQLTKKEISFKLFKKGFNSLESKKENFQKLGDLTYIVNKKNKENLKLPVYSINNKKGFISQSEQFEGIDSDERGYDISLYKIIDKETFAYNPARINVGSIGYSGNLENIIISSLYVCFKTIDKVNDEFLFQYLRTDIFRKEVLRNVEGGVRDYLFYENFSRIKINLPDLKEQVKIANFLSKFDEKINLESELLTQYENQKKYLLQNLFV